MTFVTRPLLICLFVFSLCVSSTAQFGIGGSTMDGQVGAHMRYAADLGEKWEIIPQTSLLFSDNLLIVLSSNFSRNIPISEKLQAYPLGGLTMLFGQEPMRRIMGRDIGGEYYFDLELTLGGGLKYAISHKLTLFGELQYLTSYDALIQIGTYIDW